MMKKWLSLIVLVLSASCPALAAPSAKGKASEGAFVNRATEEGAEAEAEEREAAANRRSHRPREKSEPDLSFLTTDELRILQHGEISTGSHVGGGLVGTVVGFGLGHLFYGKYGTKGWVFTVSELASLGLAFGGLTGGLANCSFGNTRGCTSGLGAYWIGGTIFLSLRIWEIIEVWTIPSSHNMELSAIKAKVGYGRPYGVKWSVYPLVQAAADEKFSYGIGLRASF